jgi:hypothetical protein
VSSFSSRNRIGAKKAMLLQHAQFQHGCQAQLVPLQLSATPPRAAIAQMSFVDVAANSGGAIVTGYLAGAAAGPALSSMAATAKGIKNGSAASLLLMPVGLASLFLVLAVALTAGSVTLGTTAVSMAPGLVKLPLAVFMLVVIVAFVPVTSLLTGTFFSPAVPFKDTAEVEEYQEMQKSYNSDSWLPPRLWTGTSSGDRDRDRD